MPNEFSGRTSNLRKHKIFYAAAADIAAACLGPVIRFAGFVKDSSSQYQHFLASENRCLNKLNNENAEEFYLKAIAVNEPEIAKMQGKPARRRLSVKLGSD